MSDLKLAVSIEEAAAAGPISRGTIYKALADGSLVARKHGRRVYIMLDDWRRFLADQPVATYTNRGRSRPDAPSLQSAA